MQQEKTIETNSQQEEERENGRFDQEELYSLLNNFDKVGLLDIYLSNNDMKPIIWADNSSVSFLACHPLVAINAGKQAREDGDDTEALDCFADCLLRYPDYEEGYFELGITYKKMGDIEEAIKYLSICLDLDPEFYLGNYEMGRVLEKKGEVDDAISYYQKEIEIYPNSESSYFSLGNCYKTKRQFEEAIKYYKKSLELNPKKTVALSNMGIVLNEVGRYDEGIEYCMKALKIQPNKANTMVILSDLYISKKEYDVSEKYINKCLALNQHHDLCYLSLAKIYEGQGYLEKAVQNLQKIPISSPIYYLTQDVFDRIKNNQPEKQ